MRSLPPRSWGAALVAVLLIASLPLGLVHAEDTDEPPDPTVTHDDMAPGEQFAGVNGVTEAELEHDLSERTFDHRLANASNESQVAAIVSERIAMIEERLQEIADRLERLEDQREAGELSNGTYRAQASAVAAQQIGIQQSAERAANVAGELPEHAQGLDLEAIETLIEKASELAGPEISEIAQSIAGADIGDVPGLDSDSEDEWPPGQGNFTPTELDE